MMKPEMDMDLNRSNSSGGFVGLGMDASCGGTPIGIYNENGITTGRNDRNTK